MRAANQSMLGPTRRRFLRSAIGAGGMALISSFLRIAAPIFSTDASTRSSGPLESLKLRHL
jgi:hypothetical protein